LTGENILKGENSVIVKIVLGENILGCENCLTSENIVNMKMV
jgi:hypothetical protein